jgi:hypothetical protein
VATSAAWCEVLSRIRHPHSHSAADQVRAVDTAYRFPGGNR